MNRRPSPATVIALLAFAVAIGGTAYAASNLPSHSVGRRQLKKGAVTKPKIAKKTLAALHGAKGPQGDTGPMGVTGPQGATGVQGAQGPGATSFATNVPDDSQFHTVKTIDGIEIDLVCTGTGAQIQVGTTPSSNSLQVSGTSNSSTGAHAIDINGASSTGVGISTPVDLNVIARNSAVASNFTRFDIHSGQNSGGTNPCPAWGMITPSTFSP